MSPKISVSEQSLNLALQRSERNRLLLLLLIVLATAVVAVLRHEAGGKVMQGKSFVAGLALIAGVAAYVLVLTTIVRRAVARDRLLPAWLWIASVVFESLIPTVAILLLQRLAPVSRLESLSAPAILLYGIFITSSILRLRPWLCVLSGALAAIGHLGLFLWVYMTTESAHVASNPGYFLAYPSYLLLTGVAAAFVSREMLRHLHGSLREADARRELEIVQNELEIARTVQAALMPKSSPNLPNFDIAGWNRPASQTGGDYYDWQLMPDGRLAVVIADVTGHGLGPAMLMAVCRAYARACFPVGPELGTALARVNALVHGDVTSGRFVTFAVALLNAQSGEVEILSAGHGPLLFLNSATNEVEEINGDGVPLGILGDEDYGLPRRIQMNPGDVLLLTTDGFTEWANPDNGELYGTARLTEVLRKHADTPAKTMIERIDADVVGFGRGSTQQDDMTAVVVRRLKSDAGAADADSH